MAQLIPSYSLAQAVKDHQPFWRFRATGTTSADFLVLDSAVMGIAVGPDSDYGLYQASVPNISGSTSALQRYSFSSRAPLTFSVTPRLGATNVGASNQNQLLISVPELDDATINPAGQIFDIVVYLRQPPSYSPRPYRYLDGAVATSNVQAEVFTLPFFGWKTAEIVMRNGGANAISDWTLQGILVDSGPNFAGTVLTHTISTGNTLAAGVTTAYALTGTYFSYLRLLATSTAGASTILAAVVFGDE